MQCYMCLTELEEEDHFELQMWHQPEDIPGGSGKVKLCRDHGRLLTRVILAMRADALGLLN